MPTKLRAASSSVNVGPALLQFEKEIGEKQEDWALNRYNSGSSLKLD